LPDWEDEVGALYPYIVAMGGILSMMAIWLLVQMAWGRVFPGVSCDVDVLAGRPKCCGCDRESDCELKTIPHGPAV
jgi:hypothetical protein